MQLGILVVPLAAVWLLGNRGQWGDWGIPVAAYAVSFLATSSVLLSHDDRSPSAPKASPADPFVAKYGMTLRKLMISNIVIYSVVLSVGIVIGVAGVLQQADQARNGRVTTQAPWSMAPSATSITIEGPSDVGLPTGGCLVQIARVGDLWTVWDPKADQLWQTQQPLVVRVC